MTETQRRAYVTWMRTHLPDVPSWDAWQAKTGALPPDFDALPRANFLPDPFRFADGRPVEWPADWAARRAEIRRLFEQYVVGTFPPKPTIDRVVPLHETRGDGYVTRDVRLEFGPGGKGTLRVEVTIPDGPGPMPVLICPSLTGWAPALVRRGYISAGYAGNDFMDDAAPLAALYPHYDFATLPRRAWVAQLVVDYLATLPQVDLRHVAIFGYSRDGKVATLAAALDSRISAVIAGSTGVGGVLPWRLMGERGMAEGVESTTRMFPSWFVPQLRFFAGHEDRLPVDANLLVALIAPRACLLEYGLNDEVSNVWGDEQCFYSARRVYQRFGHPERLDVLRVPGFHGSNDQGACLDWLDIQFGRSDRTWTNALLYDWDFARWQRRDATPIDWTRFPAHPPGDFAFQTATTPAACQQVAARVRTEVTAMLGSEPPRMPPGTGVPAFILRRFATMPGPTVVAGGKVGNPGQLAPDVPAWVIGRGGQGFGWLSPEKEHTTSRRIRFGDGLTGDLYYPAGTPADAKLPTVIWLHGYSYPLGYMWVYRQDLHPILALVKAGYAVLAFDQCGFGSREKEAATFYERYPHWSRLGRMVEDTRAAVDALQQQPDVDPARIYTFGYTLGGMVGLYAAVLDPRIKGVVSIAGFTPMRTDTPERGDGGLARLSVQRSILPQLGQFIGHESQLPYDYDDLLAAIAPRPVLVVEPQMDRDGSPAEVRAAVAQARRTYAVFHAAPALDLAEPDDYERLPTTTQEEIIRWMAGHLKPASTSQ